MRSPSFCVVSRIFPPEGHDVIGDVHGCHDELVALLRQMGYARRRGAWRHPTRLAVFVGDLVDRGPQIGEVLETVAAMVGEGTAACLLGNHERDVVFFHTLGPRGLPLRERSEQRIDQLAATHEQLGARSSRMKHWVRWMRMRPVLFEAPGLRVVHGAWNESAAAYWRGKTLGATGMLDRLADAESQDSVWLGQLLFGPVLTYKHEDRDGKRKTMRIRARWFSKPDELAGDTLWHAAFRRSPRVPRKRLTPAHRAALWGYPRDATPLITGHQSLPLDAVVRPMRANLACVDYSAVFGGRLCAYRWSGEKDLVPQHFVTVEARPALPKPLP